MYAEEQYGARKDDGMKKDTHKAFRKLKRLELVELIYQLRKENLSLEKELRRLKEQLAESEVLRREYAANRPDEETTARMETLMQEMIAECRALSARLEQHTGSGM